MPVFAFVLVAAFFAGAFAFVVVVFLVAAAFFGAAAFLVVVVFLVAAAAFFGAAAFVVFAAAVLVEAAALDAGAASFTVPEVPVGGSEVSSVLGTASIFGLKAMGRCAHRYREARHVNCRVVRVFERGCDRSV